MKNQFLLPLVLFVLGITFAYMAIVTDSNKVTVYFQNFDYNTDDYEDNYVGMYEIKVGDNTIIIEDSTGWDIRFDRYHDGHWYTKDDEINGYELIRTDYMLTLQAVDIERNYLPERLTFSSMVRKRY